MPGETGRGEAPREELALLGLGAEPGAGETLPARDVGGWGEGEMEGGRLAAASSTAVFPPVASSTAAGGAGLGAAGDAGAVAGLVAD